MKISRVKTILTVLVIAAMVAGIALFPLIARADDDFAYFSNHFMNKAAAPVHNKIDLLFVQNAKQGSLIGAHKHPKCMRLTLWPVTKDIHYFTDEPVRMSGEISPAHFVTLWQHQQNHGKPFVPNVALEGVVSERDKAPHAYHATAALGDAVYDAKTLRMSYLACPLKGGALKPISELQHVTIFFDQFTPWPPL